MTDETSFDPTYCQRVSTFDALPVIRSPSRRTNPSMKETEDSALAADGPWKRDPMNSSTSNRLTLRNDMVSLCLADRCRRLCTEVQMTSTRVRHRNRFLSGNRFHNDPLYRNIVARMDFALPLIITSIIAFPMRRSEETSSTLCFLSGILHASCAAASLVHQFSEGRAELEDS